MIFPCLIDSTTRVSNRARSYHNRNPRYLVIP